jgi:hypothetical protein
MEDQKREEEDTGDGWRVEKRKKGIKREREREENDKTERQERNKNRGKPTYNREGVWTAWTGEGRNKREG